ncbi:hypothetical protein BOX15_Mlig003785g1 [Macrostomum lignano]|uniref:Uncharacterized protein n=1 Tax=Macrostomum lignano TaxID=282301 RepID=A0A267GS43_9PLAT|nr:hypothetical protein BOX15_Mlig003785g1 [Macrostomum lignano]
MKLKIFLIVGCLVAICCQPVTVDCRPASVNRRNVRHEASSSAATAELLPRQRRGAEIQILQAMLCKYYRRERLKLPKSCKSD